MSDHPIAVSYPPNGGSAPFTPPPDIPRSESYGPGSRRSYFLDMFALSEQEARVQAGVARAQAYGGTAGPIGPSLLSMNRQFQQVVGSVEDAMKRLRYAGPVQKLLDEVEAKRSGTEQYALTAAGGGVGFIPQGNSVPTFIADAFVTAARNASVLADLLPSGPLPDSGLTISTGRFDTGASTAFATSEGGAGSSTDPTSVFATGNVGLLNGHVDLSRQLADLSEPAMIDVVLAQELGNAYGEALDKEVLNGPGGTQRILGILGLSGITSVTVTTPVTPQGVFAQIARTVGDTAVAGGRAVDTVLLHPRRMAWLSETAASPPVSLPGVRFVQVPAMPTDIGTTQDPVIALSLANAVSVFTSPPLFRAMADVLSGTLQMRAEVSGYAALLPRQVKCIGKLTGAALVAPTYS